jgi:glycosyltransferase involved in cell wall biosynthesis
MTGRALAITYVLPSLSPTGGAQAVYRHAARALVRGHRVTVLATAPRIGPPWHPEGRRLLKFWVYNRCLGHIGTTLDRYGVRACAREVARVNAATVPPADVIVATSFETAEWVADLPERVGARAYFLQDYEAWTPDLEPRVDATWRLPFVRLAVSRWLVDLGRERLGVECRGPIGNGVDADLFHPPVASARTGAPTVGAVYDRRPGKSYELLLAALESIARERPGTRFLLFGRTRLRHALPPQSRYVWNPSWDRIPELYREMDLFLHASVREGWGMPPMEAMASGCAVVATMSGGVPEFADGSCARLVPAGDQEALVSAALGLIDRPDERLALGRAARERMRAETWERVHTRMEAELLRAAGRGEGP